MKLLPTGWPHMSLHITIARLRYIQLQSDITCPRNAGREIIGEFSWRVSIIFVGLFDNRVGERNERLPTIFCAPLRLRIVIVPTGKRRHFVDDSLNWLKNVSIEYHRVKSWKLRQLRIHMQFLYQSSSFIYMWHNTHMWHVILLNKQYHNIILYRIIFVNKFLHIFKIKHFG